MLSFLAVNPPRTKIAHLKTIPLDDGRSTVEFKLPSDSYLVINRLPPAATDEEVATQKVPNKANCALAPPLHWHYFQDETFHVLEGTAKFTLDGKEKIAQAGETVFIPKQQFHTFCNASEETELSVEFVLEPGSRASDEAYFRNIWGYRDDCRKAGIPRSLPQVLLFMRRGNAVLVWPGPGFVSKIFGVFLNFVGGLIVGKWLLGYSDTYPEYYHPGAE